MIKDLGWAFLLGSALLLAGCSQAQPAETKPPLVRTQTPIPEGSAHESFSGQVKGRREVALSFQVGGEIMSRLVEVGSRVRPGELLMELSPRDVQQKRNQTMAQVASAEAEWELARTNLARYQELFAAAAISQAVLDQYRTNAQAAEAAYRRAVAADSEAQNALSYTRLVSPAAGVITGINVETGQVAAAGQTVVTLMQTEELEAEVFLPENRLQAAPVGGEARITFWAVPGEVRGIVREVAPMANAARTYRVRVSLTEIPSGLEAGMTASVVFPDTGNSGDGMLLPLGAIYQTGDTPQVWLVQEGRLCLKPVKVMAYRGDQVEVSGVEPADHVVVSGIHKLREGLVVREAKEASALGESSSRPEAGRAAP